MRIRPTTFQPQPRSAGFSYVAVLVAIMLLALCAAPAADAVRNAAAAPAVSASHLQSLLCLKSRMEVVAAEPYQNLLLMAQGSSPGYSVAAEQAGCPERKVSVRMVSVDADGVASYRTVDTGLLELIVTLADPVPGAPVKMSLATMVTR